MFHFRVRDGNGWFHYAMVTRIHNLIVQFLNIEIKIQTVTSEGRLESDGLEAFSYFFQRTVSGTSDPIHWHLYTGRSFRKLLSRAPCRTARVNFTNLWKRRIVKQVRRIISTAKLNMLPWLHQQPINVVVFHDPSGKLYLGNSLALRCFQRLSVPSLATRLCRWRDNRSTRGSSNSVLSY